MHARSGAQVGFLVIEAGFILSRSFPMLMAIFAVGELALFAGQAPFSAPPILALEKDPSCMCHMVMSRQASFDARS